MATKCITITVDAYNKLASLKEEKESFSDVINKITTGRSLIELAGITSKENVKELRKNINQLRSQMDKDFRRYEI